MSINQVPGNQKLTIINRVPIVGDYSFLPVYPDPIMWFIPFFQPTDIPGLQVWLDGTDPATVSLSGSIVQSWTDKSGNNNTMYLSTGSPTYSANAIQINSGDILQTTNYINITSSTTIYIVGVNTNGGDFSYIIAFTDLNGGDFSIRYSFSVLIGTQAQAGNADDFANNQYYVNGTFNPNFSSSTYSTTHLIDAISGGTHTGSSRISLSSSFDGRYFTGQIKEVLIYSTAPTDDQRKKVEIYLADKWGLTGNLAYGHPNQYIPPN